MPIGTRIFQVPALLAVPRRPPLRQFQVSVILGIDVSAHTVTETNAWMPATSALRTPSDIDDAAAQRNPPRKAPVMSSSSFQFSRRRLLVTGGIAGVAAATGLLRTGTAGATDAPSSYTPTWASVDQHPPAPEWFQDAKFGIYYHWGVFSVPAFANEWYPRNMYINGSNENNHHKSVYGEPSAWPYHNFVNGARDRAGSWVQFAPKLRSAGGHLAPHKGAAAFSRPGGR